MSIYTFIIIVLLIIIILKINSVYDGFYFKISLLESSIDNLREEIISLKKDNSLMAKKIGQNEVIKFAVTQSNIDQKSNLTTNKIDEENNNNEEIVCSEEELSKEKPTHSFVIKFFNSINFEEFLIKNMLLKIGVIIFIIGIGFFLKYSIDNELIPIWGRMLIGITIGNGMIFIALKMLKQPKYFSESFFGAGIAILYLSIFAGYALDTFKVLDFKLALFAMVIITMFAGVISVKFNSLTTAIFGLIGGFATPFLISSSSQNVNSFLGYLLILNLGILYISIYKRWAILSWLAFILSSILINTSISSSYKLENSSVLTLSFFSSLFFIIYAIIPFINYLKEKVEVPQTLLYLFIANFFAVIIFFCNIFYTYKIDVKFFALVTLILASFLIIAIAIMKQKNLLQTTLITTALSQSLLLILATPFIVFDNLTLTLILAIESFILLYIGYKNNQKIFILFAHFSYILTAFNLYIDILQNLNIITYNLTILDFIKINLRHWVNILFSISSFLLAFLLIKRANANLFDFSKLSINFEIIKICFFIFSFYSGFIIFYTMGYIIFEFFHLLDKYFLSYIFLLFLSFIVFYDKSEYKKFGVIVFKIFYLFLAIILFISFFRELFKTIFHSNEIYLFIPIMNFSIFILLSFFVYRLFFEKDGNKNLFKYKILELFIGFIYVSLFVFLNIEIYNSIYYFLDKTAAKISITFLWVIYSIITLIISLQKNIKEGKIVGFFLLSLAILKTFFIDLSHSQPIYKIILFIMVGLILFLTSYYYNKLYIKKQEEKGFQ